MRFGGSGEPLVRKKPDPVPRRSSGFEKSANFGLVALPSWPAALSILALTVGEIEVFKPGPPAPIAALPRSCAAPEYREFDFWLGEWNVLEAGRPSGTQRTTPLLGGCALREEWKAVGGITGTSFTMFDPVRKRWAQTRVDDKGKVLSLVGGRQGSRMVLEGDSPDGKGGTLGNRFSWSPGAANRVRHLWEISTDGGRTWETAFDGDYLPAARELAARGAGRR
jgi:hypothetical protein